MRRWWQKSRQRRRLQQQWRAEAEAFAKQTLDIGDDVDPFLLSDPDVEVNQWRREFFDQPEMQALHRQGVAWRRFNAAYTRRSRAVIAIYREEHARNTQGLVDVFRGAFAVQRGSED